MINKIDTDLSGRGGYWVGIRRHSVRQRQRIRFLFPEPWITQGGTLNSGGCCNVKPLFLTWSCNLSWEKMTVVIYFHKVTGWGSRRPSSSHSGWEPQQDRVLPASSAAHSVSVRWITGQGVDRASWSLPYSFSTSTVHNSSPRDKSTVTVKSLEKASLIWAFHCLKLLSMSHYVKGMSLSPTLYSWIPGEKDKTSCLQELPECVQ